MILEALETRYYGPWPGTVVSTADPERRGRVKIRVPQVYGATTEVEFIPDEDLPWALPCMPAHEFHVAFEVGDGVWVKFWGGSASEPVWFGQFLGVGDAPSEFISSYTPEPQTRIFRTNNGHVIEMRWVDGQEKIRIVTAGGSEFNMKDSPAEGGPLIEAFTPDQFKMSLDEQLKKASLSTPGQRSVELDDTANIATLKDATQKVELAAATLTVFSPNPVIISSTSTLALTATAAFILSALATFVLTAVGLLTLTGAGVAIVTTAGLVSIGVVGAKKKLVHEDFFGVYNNHTHPDPVTGNTGVPSTLGVVGTHTTNNTEAN